MVIDHSQAVGQVVDDRAAEKPSTVRTHAILSETAAHEVQRLEKVVRSGVVEPRSGPALWPVVAPRHCDCVAVTLDLGQLSVSPAH